MSADSGIADLFTPLFAAGMIFGTALGLLAERDIFSHHSLTHSHTHYNYRAFLTTGMIAALALIVSDQQLQVTELRNAFSQEKEDYESLLLDCKTDFDELKEEEGVLLWRIEELERERERDVGLERELREGASGVGSMYDERSMSIGASGVSDGVSDGVSNGVSNGVSDGVSDGVNGASEVSEWFRSLHVVDSSGQVAACPFRSPEDALLAMQSYPQYTDMHSLSTDKRKRLLSDLSLHFHPDKMASSHCPAEYGNAAIIELNIQKGMMT
jgi:hypothetical protein